LNRSGSAERQTQERPESRWPVVLAVLAVLVLLQVLPARTRVLPPWVPYAAVVAILLPIVFPPAKRRWLRVEHGVALAFVVVVIGTTLATLGYLIVAMVRRPVEVTGLQLLSTSVGVWPTNVLAFSLLYWDLDGGGPMERADRSGRLPDWLFPQVGVPELVPPGWRPTFVDYLFLAFSTATAFSTTEVAPLTARAKLLMMAESSISLVTMVVTASRAINILGS
jgi:hypothetical protein